jgi:predicted DNA-binding protein with PD1-like motif
MKVQEGRVGRTFLVKFEHGDDLIREILALAKKKGINTGFIMLLGALRKADMVTGPKECVVPPEPNWVNFDDGREILAMGTLICDEEGQPTLHLHGGAGREEFSLTGCLRANTEVYLVVEGIILELEGIKARRVLDQLLQMKVLEI